MSPPLSLYYDTYSGGKLAEIVTATVTNVSIVLACGLQEHLRVVNITDIWGCNKVSPNIFIINTYTVNQKTKCFIPRELRFQLEEVIQDADMWWQSLLDRSKDL